MFNFFKRKKKRIAFSFVDVVGIMVVILVIVVCFYFLLFKS